MFKGISLFAAIVIAAFTHLADSYGQSTEPKEALGSMSAEEFGARIGRWAPQFIGGKVDGLRLGYVGSSLEKLGFMAGDVIVEVDGQSFSDKGIDLAGELMSRFEQRAPVELVVVRNRMRLTFHYTGKE